jgi:small subunit ribosomal protein S21
MVNFSVEVHDNEPFERALRRFTTKTKKAGVLRDLKKKRFYVKPSAQKKIDLQKSIRRQKKAQRLAELALTDARHRKKKKAPVRGPRRD